MNSHEIINNANYKHIASIKINELGEFINAQLGLNTKNESQKKAKLKQVFIGLLFGLAVFGITFMGIYFSKSNIAIQLLFAFFGLIPTIILHELIHAAVYKFYGAPKVGFGGNIKSLIVYAYAQNFVINMSQLKVIALMPFLTLTSLLTFGIFLIPNWITFFMILLFIHSIACFGDFALVKYANKNPKHITWDDIEINKEMHFYEKI